MHLLQNKRALITGATGGIGKALVEAFIKSGAFVIGTGRNQEALTALKELWKENFTPLKASFHDTESFEHFLKDLKEKISLEGPVDVLVNNAGIVRDQLTVKVKNQAWDDTLFMNLTIPFRLSQYLFSSMMKKRFGRIINIASIVGLTGNQGQSAYSAAKGGLITLTKTLALEGGRFNITANVIAPGYINTPMTEALPRDIQEKMKEKIALKCFGSPEDVAHSAVFLANSHANYITGETLHINGGMGMF